MAETFRRNLNIFLVAVSVCFVISFTAATVQWYRINSDQIETQLFPVAVDFTFVDWKKDPLGRWSAIVYVNKVRPCQYIEHQVETVIGLLPNGDIAESTITFVGDKAPGSTRPLGWQKLDQRVQIDDPAFIEGTEFNGSFLNRCHPGNATMTTYGPFTVGVNSEMPDYAIKP